MGNRGYSSCSSSRAVGAPPAELVHGVLRKGHIVDFVVETGTTDSGLWQTLNVLPFPSDQVLNILWLSFQ
jgi:hypothetical protein